MVVRWRGEHKENHSPQISQMNTDKVKQHNSSFRRKPESSLFLTLQYTIVSPALKIERRWLHTGFQLALE
jgi:hypothetical protein